MVSFQQLKSTHILDDCQRSLDLLDYLIYHRLIHGERNIAVHEARQTYSNPWTFLEPDGAFDLGDIYRPMGDSDLWGDWDCRDWLKEGIDWWRKEIAAYTKDCFKKA